MHERVVTQRHGEQLIAFGEQRQRAVDAHALHVVAEVPLRHPRGPLRGAERVGENLGEPLERARREREELHDAPPARDVEVDRTKAKRVTRRELDEAFGGPLVVAGSDEAMDGPRRAKCTDFGHDILHARRF